MDARTSSNRKAMRSLAAKRGWETRRIKSLIVTDEGIRPATAKEQMDAMISKFPPTRREAFVAVARRWWQRLTGWVR